MGWQLPKQVSFCWADEQAIFLDVARDRYFALPRATNAAFCDWLGSGTAGDPPPTLVRNQLLESTPGASKVLPCAVATPAAFLDAPGTMAIPLAHRIRAVRATCSTRVRLRLLSLHRMLTAIEQSRINSADCGALPDIATLSCEFARVRSWLPFRRTCLADSLALVRYLAGLGVRPTLVFGITARPFAAHCWVQTESLLLSDTLDNVSRYVPIRAL